RRFAHCVRIAVGTSVIDPASPAVTGFHRVLARDAPDSPPVEDLAAHAPTLPARPVVGVILTHGQHEYGQQRRHGQVAETVTRWLAGKDCARLELDTRLDTADWHLNATPAQTQSVLARLDLVVTDRLHGLVLGLRVGTPVLAIDPVAGGGRSPPQPRPATCPGRRPASRRADAGRARGGTGGRPSGRSPPPPTAPTTWSRPSPAAPGGSGSGHGQRTCGRRPQGRRTPVRPGPGGALGVRCPPSAPGGEPVSIGRLPDHEQRLLDEIERAL